MAVTAYTGLPGHGKSYSVVEHVVLPALEQTRVVVTNLPLKMDQVRRKFPAADVRFFELAAIRDKPDLLLELAVPGCIFVLDEAQLLWPSGLQASKTPAAWLSFVTEHRHRVDDLNRSSEVVVISQDLGNVASFVRKLVEQTYRTVKLVSLGATTRFRVDVYTGPVTGPKPPSKDRVRQLYGKYEPRVYDLYMSHTQSEGDGSGAVEGSIDKRVVVWRSPALWAGAAFALVLGVGGVWAVVGYFSGPEDRASSSASATAGQAVSRGAVAVGSEARAERSSWRVSGEVRIGSRAEVWLTDGSVNVVLDEAAYCDRDVAGFVVCQWDGQEVSNFVRVAPAGLDREASGASDRSRPSSAMGI